MCSTECQFELFQFLLIFPSNPNLNLEESIDKLFKNYFIMESQQNL